MDVPTRPGDPLAQPTRARLFAVLGELRRPASTDELAQLVGLHPNGVRNHLDRLRDAGLITRDREPIARGRPRHTWSVSPDAQPGGDPPSAYAELARWLVRSLAESGATVKEVEAAGRAIGRECAPDGPDDDRPPEQRIADVLTALGFQPLCQRMPGGRYTYLLRNCPYRDAANERPQLVCGLHRGITRGLIDALAEESELVDFVARKPDEAGCVIEMQTHDDELSEAPSVNGGHRSARRARRKDGATR